MHRFLLWNFFQRKYSEIKNKKQMSNNLHMESKSTARILLISN